MFKAEFVISISLKINKVCKLKSPIGKSANVCSRLPAPATSATGPASLRMSAQTGAGPHMEDVPRGE